MPGGSGISTSSLQNDGLLDVCSQIHKIQDCVSFALRVLDLQTVSTYGVVKLCIEVGRVVARFRGYILANLASVNFGSLDELARDWRKICSRTAPGR